MSVCEPAGVLWVGLSGCEGGWVRAGSGSGRVAVGETEEPEGTGAACAPQNPPSEEETAAKERRERFCFDQPYPTIKSEFLLL